MFVVGDGVQCFEFWADEDPGCEGLEDFGSGLFNRVRYSCGDPCVSCVC